MALEDGRCEFIFSYWLVQINVPKKFAKVLRLPHFSTLGKPSAELQTKSKYMYMQFAAFLQFAWCG
jgi:hypothetical protein